MRGSGCQYIRRVSRVTRDGRVTLEENVKEGEPCATPGRLQDGQPLLAYEAGDVGSWLANAAFYEAGSVCSFRRLARELRAHGAPKALVARAERAAKDEVRHAQMLTKLAQARGATTVFRPPPAPRKARTLAAVARENAVEGCARETYAALLALHQATAAQDPEVQSAMKRIARDESRHASLAWAVAAWAEPRLAPRVRRELEHARALALEEIARAGADTLADADARRVLGLPEARAARSLGAELAARLAA